ncbi:unnamed protein product [Meganyctiphanes norvegica]|uniref:Uncharacterized protein n=1 Tax=Meganyctiphanes norvegica TaxID=48144 RepID=A0AAV2RQI6_MEGNR
MPAINSAILLLVLFVASISAEPIFFGGRRGRQRHRPLPTLPPLPSQFRLGSHRAAQRFTVRAHYIDSPELKSLQNSIDTKDVPAKESEVFKIVDTADTSEELLLSDEVDSVTDVEGIFNLSDLADVTEDNLISDDVESVTEVDVEDSTATEGPAEQRELEFEDENNTNSLLIEDSRQKSITDNLLDFNSENVILESNFKQNVKELVTESFFKVINLNPASDHQIPNFVEPPGLGQHFISEDNHSKDSTDLTANLLADGLIETVSKHNFKELTATENVLVTLLNKETESITLTVTEYSSVSYTPVFITVTDVVVETDCITINLPNTVTVYDTEIVTSHLTEYIQDSQGAVPALRTTTETRYSTLTVTSSPVSIVQTISGLLQVQTCTCVI